MKEQFQTIVSVILQVKGHDILLLHEPIMVRLSPHQWPFEVHGLCVSPKKELFVLGSDGLWNQLEESDVNADKLIASIYQRVQLTFSSLIKTVA